MSWRRSRPSPALREKAIRRIELRFDGDVDAATFKQVTGVRDAEVEGGHVVVSFDGEMEELLDAARRGPSLVDISTHEADLEEIFLTYYRDDTATPHESAEPDSDAEPEAAPA